MRPMWWLSRKDDEHGGGGGGREATILDEPANRPT